MATVLLTGTTGFVGGALAARLLKSGYRVLAISRNDPDGERTRDSVREAANGYGEGLADSELQRLVVLELDMERVESALTVDLLNDVTSAWHIAAEMSYASQKALASYHTNVVSTIRWHRLLAERARGCRRFNYVSTAYTCGMDGGPVDESVHIGREYDNAYQMTKCAAEHALCQHEVTIRLPVTVFRPTIVVGHSVTGWARRNGFGFHMFIEALAAVGRAGIDSIRFDLNPQARPDLVPIDLLTHWAVALTKRADAGADFEIFHCSGGLGLTLDAVLRTVGRQCGVDVAFGSLQTPADRRIDRAVAANRRFAETEWNFSRFQLDRAIGNEASTSVVTIEQLERMVNWYLAGGAAGTVRARRRSQADANASRSVQVAEQQQA